MLLNLGCGALTHAAWLNCDITPRNSFVRRVDFRTRLPFADCSADAVYHSHVLEHFDPHEGAAFLAENFRVLRPGGIVRVVVPDLEKLCRNYLAALGAVSCAEKNSGALYEWSRLDLLDQMVRRRSCGQLLRFVRSIDLAAHPEIANRLTIELQRFAVSGPASGSRTDGRWRTLLQRGQSAVHKARILAATAMVRAVAGQRAASAFAEGLFRISGEVHHWMYDSHSLTNALRCAGFCDVRLATPRDSAIPGFAQYELDEVGGRMRRPGSLFAEGRKP